MANHETLRAAETVVEPCAEFGVTFEHPLLLLLLLLFLLHFFFFFFFLCLDVTNMTSIYKIICHLLGYHLLEDSFGPFPTTSDSAD